MWGVMSKFKYLINAEEEELVRLFYKSRNDQAPQDQKLTTLAKIINLQSAQIVCAVGFNPNARQVTEIIPILGFDTFDELALQRNDIFTTDVYERLSLKDILNVYSVIKNDPDTLQITQSLLKKRLDKIEDKIEATVNSMIIEKYKTEVRAIYNDGIANIDFAEERLGKHESGFRALLNEVAIIIESKLIPAGDIFFRDTILPEEKRKLLNTGLIPKDLIESRLEDDQIAKEENRILHDYLNQHHK